jgi:hypothetical protein
MRFYVLIFLSLLMMQAAWAQKSCRVDLPVGVVGMDGSLLNGLTASDVTVHLRKQTLAIENVGYDTGPRRILFVLDTSRRLPPEARKAETMMVSYVLSKARPADSFALMTARGASRQVHFEEGRDALMKAVQELAADPKEQTKTPNILDTMMNGVHWFGEPRPGDAIILMADHLEESNSESQYQGRGITGVGPMQGVVSDRGPSFEASSRYKFSAVADTLAVHGIRVFGLQLGALNFASGVYEPSEENLLGITLGSGGYLILDAADAFGSYVWNDARAGKLQNRMYQLYGAIAQFYVLRVNAPTPLHREFWTLELAKDLRKNTRALYPHLFDPCAPAEAH